MQMQTATFNMRPSCLLKYKPKRVSLEQYLLYCQQWGFFKDYFMAFLPSSRNRGQREREMCIKMQQRSQGWKQTRALWLCGMLSQIFSQLQRSMSCFFLKNMELGSQFPLQKCILL